MDTGLIPLLAGLPRYELTELQSHGWISERHHQDPLGSFGVKDKYKTPTHQECVLGPGADNR